MSIVHMVRFDAPAKGSHVLELLGALWRLGVFTEGIIPTNILHDNDCLTLKSFDCFDCRCDCDALIGGKLYSFSEYVLRAECVQ